MLQTSSRAYATVFATDRDQEPQRALVACAWLVLFARAVCVANAAAYYLQHICSLFAAISSLRSRGMQILDFGVYRPSRTYMRCAIKVLLQLRHFEAVAFRSWTCGIQGPSRTYAVSFSSLIIISSFRSRGLRPPRTYVVFYSSFVIIISFLTSQPINSFLIGTCPRAMLRLCRFDPCYLFYRLSLITKS